MQHNSPDVVATPESGTPNEPQTIAVAPTQRITCARCESEKLRLIAGLVSSRLPGGVDGREVQELLIKCLACNFTTGFHTWSGGPSGFNRQMTSHRQSLDEIVDAARDITPPG